MAIKPILFNTPMIQAILDGRKTVTRRVANINTEIPCIGRDNHSFVWDNLVGAGEDEATGFICKHCGFGVSPPHSRYPCGTSAFRPRYVIGDILYVRETFTELFYVDPDGYTHFDKSMYYYAADGTPDITLVDGDGFVEDDQRIRWKPSIHMPKDAARIFLRVTDVRVERLQDISADQCAMEGVCPLYAGPIGGRESYYKTAFAKLWNSTIKKEDLLTYGWDANPWVFVYRFERCENPFTETEAQSDA